MAAIWDEEKAARRRSNESVLGSFAMEGMFPDDATRTIFCQYEDGFLSLDQFSEAMDRHARRLVAELGKMAGAA